MKVEFIYTYNSCKLQEIAIHPFVSAILKDEQTLFEFAVAGLSEEEKNDLIRISTCIYLYGAVLEEPEWFKNSNGKLWIKDGKLES